MADAKNPALPSPPNLISALRSGFDIVANHIAVILFPILLDLLLWLGPHVQMRTLLQNIISLLTSSSVWNSTQTEAVWESYQEMLQEAAVRLNLMASLRSIPVGIPSLMSGRLPIVIPGGEPIFWDISNVWVLIVLGFFLYIMGLGVGSLYFILVSQVVMGGEIGWQKALRDWPRAMLQVLSFTLALVLVLLVISLPASCVLSAISWGGISFGQIGILLTIGVLLWLGFPLVFTPHGIFAARSNVLLALRKSIRLTRLTFPNTALLFLAVLVISEGLDILWRVPAEDSWLVLLGVAGHAFVTTGLLAATFVYYRDADRWVQKMLEKVAEAQSRIIPPI